MKQFLITTDAGRFFVKAHSIYNSLLVFRNYAHDKRREGLVGLMPFLEDVREVPNDPNGTDDQIVFPLPLPKIPAGALPTPAGVIPTPIG